MAKDTRYHYFVEGPDDEKIVTVLRSDLRLITPGRITPFNVIEKRFTLNRIRPLKAGTTVVLVYDTDTGNPGILEANIDFLSRQHAIRRVLCIPQITNLEDELIYSCGIKSPCELTKSRSLKDYKRDLLAATNIDKRLAACGFSIEKFWSRQPGNGFAKFGNDSKLIKL